MFDVQQNPAVLVGVLARKHICNVLVVTTRDAAYIIKHRRLENVFPVTDARPDATVLHRDDNQEQVWAVSENTAVRSTPCLISEFANLPKRPV